MDFVHHSPVIPQSHPSSQNVRTELRSDEVPLLSIAKFGSLTWMMWSVLYFAAGEFRVQTGEHWAFQPIVKHPLPVSSGHGPVRNLIDAALPDNTRDLLDDGAEGKRILIRRLSFDLRGLPPGPEEVDAFVAESKPDAYERLVDRYLASPQYGERWGRHWLDMVGYADSNGYFNADSDRPLAWKYRDYVVASINADKPINRFIMEQIAGDELAHCDSESEITPEKVEALIATHFWRNVPDGTGESDGNPLEVKVDQYSVLEGNVQLLGAAFLGLTLQCARCHDHKFEPITQRDYYSLQALIRPAFDPEHWVKPNDRAIAVGKKAELEKNKREIQEHGKQIKLLREGLEGLTEPFKKRAVEENLARLDEPLRKSIQQALDTKGKDRDDVMKALLKTNEHYVTVKEEELKKRFPEFAAASRPLQEGIKSAEASTPKPLEKLSILLEPARTPPAHHLLLRGSHAKEGDEVPPALPAVFVRDSSDLMRKETASPSLKTSGRRSALGRWLTSAENPVTTRVFVNRVWALHFGVGLVASTDNLGRSGAAPKHPELLDDLIQDFWVRGWSLKELNRLIVTSAAYRSRFPKSWDEKSDPGPRRLDAESIRDTMLMVSGELDLKTGGAYTPVKVDSDGQVNVDEAHPGAKRRSLYLQQRRTQPMHLLGTFDGPAHTPVCIQRAPSTVVLQSLTLLNSDFIRRRAQAFGFRVLRETTSANQAAIDRAFALAYSRFPTAKEKTLAGDFFAAQQRVYSGDAKAGEKVWTDFCQMLLASNEFLYVD